MAQPPYEIISTIKTKIENASRVAIFAHKNPDGDSLGSTIALSLALDHLEIKNDLICIDPPGQSFAFLPKVNEFIAKFNSTDYDLALIPDIGDLKLTLYHETHLDFFKSNPVIRIDHHPTGNLKPKLKWVDSDYASTTQMLVDFFQATQWPITPEIATCLLTGLYTDTGSFQHSNTTASVFRTAGRLLRLGGSYRSISKSVFQRIPLSTLCLWGKVLSRIERNEEGVVVSAVTQKDYRDCGATRDQLAGAVDYLNAVEGSYSMLLTEEKDQVKASLRTKSEEVDVSAIAKEFGGGGHIKAAGFTLPGHLKAETHWRVVTDSDLRSAHTK